MPETNANPLNCPHVRDVGHHVWMQRGNGTVCCGGCYLRVWEYINDLHKENARLKSQVETERAAKRGFATALMGLVEIGRWLAELQPAIVSRTQQEADVWAKWYRLLHEAPVVTKDDLDSETCAGVVGRVRTRRATLRAGTEGTRRT
jgi:hypothetical protein